MKFHYVGLINKHNGYPLKFHENVPIHFNLESINIT